MLFSAAIGPLEGRNQPDIRAAHGFLVDVAVDAVLLFSLCCWDAGSGLLPRIGASRVVSRISRPVLCTAVCCSGLVAGPKDCRGFDRALDFHAAFRPRGYNYAEWSIAQLEAEADRLSDAVTNAIREREFTEAREVEALEVRIADLIAMGASDRDTAIRWICDSIDHGGDLSYVAISET